MAGRTRDLTKKEAKIILLIDNSFKYDDIDKGKKLCTYLEEKIPVRSQAGDRFVDKLEDFCDFGIISSKCPICGAFLEGRGKLLCKDCAEEMKDLTTIEPEEEKTKRSNRNKEKDIPLAKIEKSTKEEKIAKPRPEKKVKEIKVDDDVNIDNEPEEIYDRKKYFIIPKNRFYICVATAVAVAMAINCIIAVTGIMSSRNSAESFMAQIESTEIPAGIEK